MAGLFQFEQSSEEAVSAIGNVANKMSYLLPLDQRLANHKDLKQLRMRVTGTPLFKRIDSTANTTVTLGDPALYVGEEMKFPITADAVQALVMRAQEASGDYVNNLVDLVNQALSYREGYPAGSVERALTIGYGECTDFADLLTTVARAAGLPARTIFGLAYKDGENPALMFHAWNEIYQDSSWRAVDPTWNQTRTDATHIPLPPEQAAHLLLAQNRGDIRFEVLNYEYF